jgi:6-phosphogluconolactonase
MAEPGVESIVSEDPALEVATLLATAEGNVALAGGSTPRRAYELAAQLRADWRSLSCWWGDERCVPPDDERSNYLLAKAALLDRVEHLPETHRIRGELGAEEAGHLYDEELDGITLDLALLGIGPDGHTASLFPNGPSLEETERRAVAAAPGLEPWVERVTLTLPVFSAARLVIFLATGAEKADAVRRAFGEPPSPETPASLVRGRRTAVYLDQAAAALLERPG